MPELSSTPSTSAPQSTQATNGSSNDTNTSPAGSPPLILAFLAIGIFAAAMIAVFGWRRVQFSRDTNLWGYRVAIASDTRRRVPNADPAGSLGGAIEKDPGKRPIMWEGWTDGSNKVGCVDYGCWESTMPLAVSPVQHGHSTLTDQIPSTPISGAVLPSPSELPLSVRSQPTTPPRSSRRRRRFEDITPLFTFSRHTRTNPPSDIPLTSARQLQPDKKAQREEEDRHIQVVMIIEMPSPSSSRHRHAQNPYTSLSKSDTSQVLDTDRHSGNFQYCIGTHTCRWPFSNATGPTKNGNPERISQLHANKVMT